MISVSGDEELLEALGHVSDGVFHVYVALGYSPSTTPVDRVQPHQIIGALSSLLAGFTHGGGLQGSGSAGCAEPGVDDSRRRSKSSQEQETGKHESDAACQKEVQDIRQLIVDAANALLEPLGWSRNDQ